jgi:hypothetical protein
MQPAEHHGHGPIYECGSGKAFVRAGSRPGNKQACRKRLIGYARVSTYGQTLDSQLEQPRVVLCRPRR